MIGFGFVVAAWVDAWARVQPANPIAPWQDLPVYSAWLLLTGFLVAVLGRNLADGKDWRTALPPGYHLALVGGLIFGLGAIADVYYQLVSGIAQGIEALLSPTHLIQLVGGSLQVAAPLSQALRERPDRAGWPVVLAAASTLSALTFFTQFMHPLIDLWPARGWGPQGLPPWVIQRLGVGDVLVQVSILVGLVLLLIRSFALPTGSLTVLLTLNGLCLTIVGRHPELLAVPVLTGLAADAMLPWLRPQVSQAAGLRAFSAAVPALYTILYGVSITFLEGGSLWPLQLWLGVIMAAGLAGFLVSYVAGIRRPRSVVAGEVWEEVWPRRHVEITPASVKDALDALADSQTLSASALTQLPCISAKGDAAGAELHGLLVDIVKELAAARAPRDAEAGRLLDEYYVRKVGSHELIAERLHLSRPTFYRRLQRGLALTAERLDELAEFAARHPDTQSPAP